MRLQSITRNFLASIFLFRLIYAVHVPSPTDHLSLTKNVAAEVAVRGGDNSAMDQTMIDNNSDPAIRKRKNPNVPSSAPGVLCGKAFYAKDLISRVAEEACNELLKKNPGKNRQKAMSCAPNVPYCNYNFPHPYKGTLEFFRDRGPLYVWPIGTSRFRKFIGSKGNDRIVFRHNQTCKVIGLIHKNFWGKWSLCQKNW